MAMTKEQNLFWKRGYSKGYQSGMRTRKAYIKQLEDQQYERIYLAVLNGVLSSGTNWTVNGETVTSASEWADVARRIANAASKELK